MPIGLITVQTLSQHHKSRWRQSNIVAIIPSKPNKIPAARYLLRAWRYRLQLWSKKLMNLWFCEAGVRFSNKCFVSCYLIHVGCKAATASKEARNRSKSFNRRWQRWRWQRKGPWWIWYGTWDGKWGWSVSRTSKWEMKIWVNVNMWHVADILWWWILRYSGQ